MVGREVTEFGDQDERYFSFTIPTGQYIKAVLNAGSFEEMVTEQLGKYFRIAKKWAEETGFAISESFCAEVYPHETTMLQYPEMYLLFPVQK